MITCEFFGGLGNNLFQLATVYAIHKKHGFELQIPSITGRGNIASLGQEPNLEIHRLFDNDFIYNNSLNLPKYNHADMELLTTNFEYKEFPIQDNICYNGYFQSDRYFLGVDISKELKLKQENIDRILEHCGDIYNKKTISLHYRLGGDRVLDHMQHYHKNVSIDYYKKALSLIGDYNSDDYNILVFSDKMNMCKEILKNLSYPFIFVEDADNVTDFTMMSMCDINIIGNSTFSWWAAYMNQNENKKIIVPESEWFGPGYSHFNLTDSFPKSWIRL